MRTLCLIVLSLLTGFWCSAWGEEAISDAASIKKVSGVECVAPCRFAVFFLHGFTGNPDKTWGEGSSSWPTLVASDPALGSRMDVYKVRYTSSWFSHLNLGTIVAALGSQFDDKMRDKKYDKVILIAHSLGGNVSRNYLIHVKLKYGHTALSRFPLVVLLGTPMEGSELARIKSLPGVSAQLSSLTPIAENDYLTLLEQSLTDVAVKRSDNHCTPIFVMAGYEEHPILGHIVVSQNSATRDATESRGFSKNHLELPKPGGRDDGVYQWVDAAIKSCLGGGYQCPTEQICTQLGDFR
jgi:pimeloyl-ACP methyl ester carboxylesterase